MSEQRIPAQNERQEVEYREIPGFPGYRVGSDGSVWSRWTRSRKRTMGEWHQMTPTITHGYAKVRLTSPTGYKSRSVHSLVLTAFAGPRPTGMQACHRDDDKSNNAPTNLYWGTPLSNAADKLRNGRMPFGDKSGRAKLTDDEVLQICESVQAGEAMGSVAARFFVALQTVMAIVSGKSRKYLRLPKPAGPRQRHHKPGHSPYDGRRKFTDDTVREIRARSARGESNRAIAASLGVHHSTIALALSRRTYGDVG